MYGGISLNAIVKVIIDNFENPMNILDDIRVGTIEKIDVYKNTDAAIYNCDIAINITLFSSRSFIYKNDSYIVNGYHK